MMVEFVTSDESPEVLKPADRAFDLPASSVATKLAPVLCGGFPAILSMWTNQFGAASGESSPQRIAVGRLVVNQAGRPSSKHTRFEKRLNQRDFCRAGTGDGCCQRKPVSVAEHHGLGALTSFRLPHACAPFFAEEKVPSANDSSWAICPCRSSFRNSLAQAFSQSPASVQTFKRRQHVAGEGKCLGRSFQRAPLRSIQRIPSKQGRDATRGRPPSGPTGVSGNRSAIKYHCSSVSSKKGSVLDPAGDSTAKRDRFVMSDLLSVSLSTTNTKQWFS